MHGQQNIKKYCIDFTGISLLPTTYNSIQHSSLTVNSICRGN